MLKPATGDQLVDWNKQYRVYVVLQSIAIHCKAINNIRYQKYALCYNQQHTARLSTTHLSRQATLMFSSFNVYVAPAYATTGQLAVLQGYAQLTIIASQSQPFIELHRLIGIRKSGVCKIIQLRVQ